MAAHCGNVDAAVDKWRAPHDPERRPVDKSGRLGRTGRCASPSASDVSRETFLLPVSHDKNSAINAAALRAITSALS
jgi:hypothetical protein